MLHVSPAAANKVAGAVSAAPRHPCTPKHAQSIKCPTSASRSDASAAPEALESLVRDVAGVDPSLLHRPELLQTVRALASGDAQGVAQYSGDQLGICALHQLLEQHLPAEQQAALAAAAAAAAAAPPRLSAQQEVLQLLQEPLVSTAFSRMRCDPQLGLNSYGSNPSVSRAMELLQQVLAEDQHTSQVVEFMRSAAAACRSAKQQQQQQQERASLPRPLKHQRQQHQHQHQQQQPTPQRLRQPAAAARTAVIARSASNHGNSSGNSSGSSSGDGWSPATKP